MSTVYDPGLQPERTLLAWRRTCLSFALAGAVAVRFTTEVAGPLAVVAGVLGVGLALGAYAGIHRRYRAAHRSLVARNVLEYGALPLFAVASAAVVLGVAGAGFVVGSFVAGLIR
jgi:uncharacterized membrane protein YidH (DUF202 family)